EAKWNASVSLKNGVVNGYGSNGWASGTVTQSTTGILVPAPPGVAQAMSDDPMVFHFSTAGSLGYTYTLGSPGPSSSSDLLSIQSNDPRGQNVLQFDAAFHNVSLNGQSLNGDLFTLTLSSSGIVTSDQDIAVSFVPWSGLGMSPNSIQTIQQTIQ